MGVAGDAVSVRLVEWNVAMSLHTKAHLLAVLKPTVAILPASAHPDKSGQALRVLGATSNLVGPKQARTLPVGDMNRRGHIWIAADDELVSQKLSRYVWFPLGGRATCSG